MSIGRWMATVVIALMGMGGSIVARAQETPPFSEAERVTAVDVMIGLETDRAKLPRGLEADDFRVRVGDQPRVPVALDDPRARRDEDRDPWRLVVYLDLGTATSHTVRWAGTELAARVDRLTQVGVVEVVVADPVARRVLAPTREPAAIRDALADLAIDGEGRDELLAGRAAFLEALHDERAPEARRAIGDLAREETARVERLLDEMLLYLVDSAGGPSARVVLLVTDGFDLEPGRFYDSWARRSGMREGIGAVPAAGLADRIESLGATLASYGWVVMPVAPPAPGPGLVPGWRIGKWRLGGGPEGPVGGVVATHEERRKPKDAEAFLELAAVRVESGELDEAREAYERAIYFFAGDPRTAELQARAKAGLGRVLAELGEESASREALRHAIELDADWTEEFPAAQASMLAPRAPLERLARATVGSVAQAGDDLDRALDSVADRLRLTYQVTGWPEGLLLPLEVSLDRSGFAALRRPRWARSGTPPSVHEARARRLLWGDLDEGELRLELSREGGELLFRVDLPEDLAPLEGETGRPFLVSVGLGGEDGSMSWRHQRVVADAEADAKRGDPWLHRVAVPSVAAAPLLALVVEDLVSGRWGAAVREE